MNIADRPLKQAFENEVVVLPVASIKPSKNLTQSAKRSIKQKRIVASLVEVGLVEPLVVTRGSDGGFLLLDGHARLAALSEVGIDEARCIVAIDDEAFTYNKRIAHLATIQEHYMIIKALNRGVSEQRIAAALNLDVAAIRRRRTMLDGICPEVVQILRSKSVNIGVFSALRGMTPLRQIEAVELMMAAGNLTASYAKVLLAGTRNTDLAHPEKRKKIKGLTAEQMDRMQREMEAVQAEFKTVEQGFGPNMLQLVVATGYINTLIQNKPISKYMEERYPEILAQFRSIVRATSLDQPQMV